MLVNYSSSSSEEESEVAARNRKRQRKSSVKDASPTLKKREYAGGEQDAKTRVGDVKGECIGQAGCRLPLPDSVLDMFADSEERHSEISAGHGGRVRSFQHERGNWATYIYLPYEPDDAHLELLDDLRIAAAAHGVSLTQVEEFHVSLSKTVVLRHHWIQPFVQSLRLALAQYRRFLCLANKLKVYSNPEKTRTFLGLEISTGCTQLLDVVRIVDETMEEFNLSTFFKDPSFHVSLAWCVGDVSEKLQDMCLSELQSLVDNHEDGPYQIRLQCTKLCCKTGNKIFTFPLQ